MQVWGDPTFQSKTTERQRVVSLDLRADRPMCSFPIAKQSTFQVATWLSAEAGWMPSTDLIRNSGKPVTTWIFAGEREKEEESWGSVRQPWSGITTAGPYGRTGNSRWVMARPRPCSRKNRSEERRVGKEGRSRMWPYR